MRCADVGEAGLLSVVDDVEHYVSPVVVLDIEDHGSGWGRGRLFGGIDVLPSSARDEEEGNAQAYGNTRQV
jgi:hypothetical protein